MKEFLNENKTKIFQGLIILLFAIWAIYFLLFKNSILPNTSLILLLINLVTLMILNFNLTKREKIKFSILIISLLLISFIILILNLNYGNLFGYFVYTEILNFKVFEVPIAIALNWSLVLLSTYHVVRNFIKVKWMKILMTGILVLFFDFIFELFAKKFQLWVWTDLHKINYIGIPLNNYFSWFIIGILSAFIINNFKQKIEPKILITFWFCEIFFFQLLQLIKTI